MATKPNTKTTKPAASVKPEAVPAVKAAPAKPVSAKSVAKAPKLAAITAEERWRMVAEAAYFIAEKRGFQNGDPAQDWIEAEKQIDAILGKA